jgi:SARP family transcriptional regulator, regulator of embCAB operon
MNVFAQARGSHNGVNSLVTRNELTYMIAVEPAPAASRYENDRIEIRILDGTSSLGSREVRLTDREFAIVAAMALNRGTLNREEWCDKLWPDRDSESAARLLKVYVHRIRAKFGTVRVIETHGNGYRLGRNAWVDVGQLEEITRGHDVARDRLDAETFDLVTEAFENIRDRCYRRIACLDYYEELERRFVAIGGELARLIVHEAFLRGDNAYAARIAEDLVLLDPYDEVAAELFIRAQLLLGREDAAARHFRTFCRTLRDELNVPPPQHLTRLFAR